MAGEEVLERLRVYLEKESGYDALVVHGIVEAISTTDPGTTREDAEEIAQVYLEGNTRALELVKDYFEALDSESGGEDEPQGDRGARSQVAAPPGFDAPEEGGGELKGESGSSSSSSSAASSRRQGKREKKKGARGVPGSATDPLAGLDKVLMPFRKHCNCHATRHDLLANCLSCGRIVCTQEGEGPCLFCGALVVRDREARYAALAERQRRSQVEGGGRARENMERAAGEKDRLVGYDRASAKQTAIIDDQSDFFEIDSNIWLSQEEKAELKKREEEIEAQMREDERRVYITFDLLGRKVLSADGPSNDDSSSLLDEGKVSIPSNPGIDRVPKFKTRA
ncbi:zf-C2HC5 domain-containing protein [Chloropicon primus]|uniref:Uncharacterized protein n=1 Tax=Chloropicon primus TaxID=1764295 RepID=A0A5B8MFN1_9CHLO|nr:hypothetical protein A3770_02p17050 [Chloropicon primus]UPQ98395.1 zf-C2HC5 domain-containing protein [Chloropicon primus]|eukprot:QDZ19187.1 hypothetical protein A3770_02p17050 [Chloropicon primus]